MKIAAEHLAIISAHFASIGKDKILKHREFLISPQNQRPATDLDKRLRWDVINSMPSLNRIPLFNSMYKAGMNDSHIDTALKAALKQILL